MTSLKSCLFIDPIDKAFLGHLDHRYVNHGPRATLQYQLFQRVPRFKKKDT